MPSNEILPVVTMPKYLFKASLEADKRCRTDLDLTSEHPLDMEAH